jgi:hypothetical protein
MSVTLAKVNFQWHNNFNHLPRFPLPELVVLVSAIVLIVEVLVIALVVLVVVFLVAVEAHNHY